MASLTTEPSAVARTDRAASQNLAALIEAAELRLIEGDEIARRRFDTIGDKIAALPRPRDLVVPAVAAVSGVVALTWLVRRIGRGSRRKPRADRASGDGHEEHGNGSRSDRRKAGLPWFQLIGFAWPLLPQHWRSRLEPTTASALLAVGLPWFQSAFVRDRGESQPPLQTVGALDLAQFSGTWFEIARLPTLIEPQCDGQPATVYTLLPEGEEGELQVAHRCVTPRGYQPISEGIVKALPEGGGSKFKVSVFPEWWRWLPFAWADEWVIAIDRGYQRALIGDPQRRQFRVLSREPELPEGELDEMLVIAREQGFDLERLKVNTAV